MITEAILTMLSGGGLGAIIGSVGGIAEKIISKKLDYAHKEREWTHIAVMHELQMKADGAKFEHELFIKQEVGRTQTLSDSIQHDSSLGDVHRWVNDIRALFRPAITGALVGLAYFQAETYINLATMSVSWWFGSRTYKR